MCLIPKQPLAPHTRYDVSIEATWRGITVERTWSFTTVGVAPPTIDAADAAAVRAATDTPSHVTGTVTYASLLDSENAWLEVGTIAVVMPIAEWNRLTAMRPDQVLHRTVTIDTMLTRDGDRVVAYPRAEQLTFTPPVR